MTYEVWLQTEVYLFSERVNNLSFWKALREGYVGICVYFLDLSLQNIFAKKRGVWAKESH